MQMFFKLKAKLTNLSSRVGNAAVLLFFFLKYCPVHYTLAHSSLPAWCYSEIPSDAFVHFLAWTGEWLL